MYNKFVLHNMSQNIYILTEVVSAFKHKLVFTPEKWIFPKSRLSILSTFTGLGFLHVFHQLDSHVVHPCLFMFVSCVFFTLLLCRLFLIGCLWWSDRVFSLALFRSCSTFWLYENKIYLNYDMKPFG